MYLKNDGGSTWDSNNLPLSGSSNTLTGIQFQILIMRYFH